MGIDYSRCVIPVGTLPWSRGQAPFCSFRRALQIHLSNFMGKKTRLKKKKKFGPFWKILLSGCFGKGCFLLMPQSEFLETTLPCRVEALDSARTRAHPKTLLFLAEEHAKASSSADSCSLCLNLTNLRDLNVLKCLPGHFLVPFSPGLTCECSRVEFSTEAS